MKKKIIVEIDGLLKEALEKRKEETGASYAFIIRKALTEYFRSRGIL